MKLLYFLYDYDDFDSIQFAASLLCTETNKMLFSYNLVQWYILYVISCLPFYHCRTRGYRPGRTTYPIKTDRYTKAEYYLSTVNTANRTWVIYNNCSELLFVEQIFHHLRRMPGKKLLNQNINLRIEIEPFQYSRALQLITRNWTVPRTYDEWMIAISTDENGNFTNKPNFRCTMPPYVVGGKNGIVTIVNHLERKMGITFEGSPIECWTELVPLNESLTWDVSDHS